MVVVKHGITFGLEIEVVGIVNKRYPKSET
jgi:hypothetical protein